MKSNKVKNVWDTIYEYYRGPNNTNKYIYSKLIRVLRRYITRDTTILEVGSGSGYTVSHFQNQKHFSVGLDSHITPLKIAKHLFKAENLKDQFGLSEEDASFIKSVVAMDSNEDIITVLEELFGEKNKYIGIRGPWWPKVPLRKERNI